MAIQRFNSIGSNTPRFRHNSLVALRYEETAQAEPPIPLPQQQQQQQQQQQRQQHGGSNTSRLPRSRSVRPQAPSQTPPLDVAAVKVTLAYATVLDAATLRVTAIANRNSERHTAAETQPAARLSLTDLPATHPAPAPAEMRRRSLPPPPGLCPSSAAATPSSPVLSSPLAPVTSRRPLVIVRPPSLVAPPAEDHPALRQRRFRPIVEEANESDDTEDAKSRENRSREAIGNGQSKDAFKRDSLIASATTSTTTLGQEDNDRNDKRDRMNGYAATRMRRSTSASSGQSVSTTASTAASTAPCPVADVPRPVNTCPAAKENTKTAKPPSATVRSGVTPVRVSTGVRASTGARAATKPTATSPKPTPKPAVAREAHWWQSKPMRRFGFSSGPSGPSSESSESSLPRSQGNKKTSSSRTAVAANVAAAENRTHKAQAMPQHVHNDKGALRGGQPQADDRRRVWKQEAASGTRVYTYTPILPCHTAMPPQPARLTKANPNAAWSMRNAPSGSSSASCSSASPASLSFSSPPSSPHPTTSPLSPASSIASSFSSSSSSIPVPARSFVRVSSMSEPQTKTTPPTRTKTKTRAGAVSSSSATTPPPAATGDAPLLRTAIPTESLIEDDFLASLTFSKRGSILLGGARALAMADDDMAAAAGAGAGDAAAGDSAVASSAASSSSFPAGPTAVSASSPARPPRSPASPWSPWSPLSLRPEPLPLAVARESHKVRSLYAAASTRGRGSGDAGGGLRWQDGRPPSVVVGGVAVEAIGEKEGASAPAVAAEAAAPPPRPSSSAPHGSTAMTDKNAAPSIHSPDLSSLSRPGGAGDGDGDGLLQPYPYPYPPSAAAAAARISIVSSTSATSAPTSLALSDTASTEEGGDTTSTLPSTAGQTGETSGADTTTAATNNNNFLAVPAAGSSSTPSSPTIDPAGGIEDWEDVDVADVDRFGFIHVRQRPHTSASTAGNTRGDGGGGFLRRHGSRRGRHLQGHGGNHYDNDDDNDRPFGARSVHSRMTTAGGVAAASLRAAANRLPHNRDRRWVDGAGDMLALAPGGLADIAEDADAVRVAEVLKRKEAERAEKWRRMAKVVGDGGGGGGGGMTFEFDPRHPKLVERTWKGIPDCWRAAAWYSFLATSARERRQARAGRGGGAGEGVPERDGGETEEQIVAAFRALQEQGSPDDVQIDLDVPRTVNGHVMFRRRYRGGQRLLFRVLHAVSLYFPATGYVQGMASLAATLLCYFDEERSFVMLVRLFHLRGLERLYQPGFGGLLEALAVMEQRWLRTTRHNRAVAARLAALGIDAPTYATRWYLTVFNLSVPFRAQLRIWDVFLLLGGRPVDEEEEAAVAAAAVADPTLAPASDAGADAGADPPLTAARANLDVLHATSAALLDGLHEVLVDADFENAMKALTAWVPIKDEELLMKVVRAEWKRHQKG